MKTILVGSFSVQYDCYIMLAIIQQISSSSSPDKFLQCWSLTLSEPELKINDPETIGHLVRRNSAVNRTDQTAVTVRATSHSH